MALPASAVAEPRSEVRSYSGQSLDRLRRDRYALAAGMVIVILTVIAILEPLLLQYVIHHNVADQDLGDPFVGLSAQHWLGTDELGRDTMARLVAGARVSLYIAFLAVALAVTFGGGVGILAGYVGGWVDNLLMRLVDIVLAIPQILLFMLLSILLRPGIVALALIIAGVSWISVARIVRSEVLSLRTRDFIMATRSIGASPLRLLARHVFPNVMPTLVVTASLGVGQIILVEAALDYLGLGVQPPTPSWGNMLSNAQSYFMNSPILVIAPGCLIVVTVLALTLFGNAIRDAFDPRITDVAS